MFPFKPVLIAFPISVIIPSFSLLKSENAQSSLTFAYTPYPVYQQILWALLSIYTQHPASSPVLLSSLTWIISVIS